MQLALESWERRLSVASMIARKSLSFELCFRSYPQLVLLTEQSAISSIGKGSQNWMGLARFASNSVSGRLGVVE